MGAMSSLAALFGSAFLLIAGNGLMSTLVPLSAKLDGFPAVWLGLIGSSYFAGMLLGTFGAPWVIRQTGYVGAFALFLTVAVASTLAFPVIVDPLAWLILRGLVGFVFAGLYAVIEGWLSARSNDANRGRVYAVYQIMTYGGSAVGQQLLGHWPGHTAAMFVTTAACYMSAMLPLVVSRTPPPQAPRDVQVRLLWFIKASPIGATAALCIGAANGSFYSLAPVFGLGRGLTTGEIATFMTAVTIGTACALYPVAYVSDVRDRRLFIVAFALIGAVTEILLSRVVHGAGPLLWSAATAMGASSFVLYTLAFAHANARIAVDRSLVISAAMLFLYCFGAILAPILASIAMRIWGVGALFLQNGLIHMGLAAAVLWRMTQRPPKPASAAFE